MRKTALLISTILLSAIYCFSQDKGYVAISVGPSIPTGDFGSKDLKNETAGLAKTGSIFDLSFAYRLGKNLGLTALLRGQSNPVDNQVLLDELYKESPNASWKVESKNWSLAGFLFGGYGSFPIGSGITSFEARGMIGFLRATSSEVTLTGIQNGVYATVKVNSAHATAFSYLIGAGFKFNVGKKICLFTNLDLLGSTPEFRNVETTSNFGSYSTDTVTQNIATINFGFGIGLRL